MLELRRTGQYAPELPQRWPDTDARRIEDNVPNRPLVGARAPLEDGQSPAHLAQILVVTQQDHCIREVADIAAYRVDITDQAMLHRYQHGRDVLLAEVGQQIADLDRQITLVAHRG